MTDKGTRKYRVVVKDGRLPRVEARTERRVSIRVGRGYEARIRVVPDWTSSDFPVAESEAAAIEAATDVLREAARALREKATEFTYKAEEARDLAVKQEAILGEMGWLRVKLGIKS